MWRVTESALKNGLTWEENQIMEAKRDFLTQARMNERTSHQGEGEWKPEDLESRYVQGNKQDKTEYMEAPKSTSRQANVYRMSDATYVSTQQTAADKLYVLNCHFKNTVTSVQMNIKFIWV